MPIERPRYLASRRIHPKARVDTAQLPDGRLIEPLILEFNDWTGVLALTPAQEVLLVRLYRRGVDDVIWEIPGGMIGPAGNPAGGGRSANCGKKPATAAGGSSPCRSSPPTPIITPTAITPSWRWM